MTTKIKLAREVFSCHLSVIIHKRKKEGCFNFTRIDACLYKITKRYTHTHAITSTRKNSATAVQQFKKLPLQGKCHFHGDFIWESAANTGKSKIPKYKENLKFQNIRIFRGGPSPKHLEQLL